MEDTPDTSEHEDRLLTEREVAQRLGLKPNTLAGWRSTRCRNKRRGPPFVRIGGSIRFRASTLEAWLKVNERTPQDWDAADAKGAAG